MDIEPRGFKYIVTTTLSENLGQAGRYVHRSSASVPALLLLGKLVAIGGTDDEDRVEPI